MRNSIEGKKLPLGLSNFSEVINHGGVYVDKTSIIHSLINELKYYFLSRPRRFGKSLLVSTLKEIFLGRKELFEGCAIYSSDYSWKKHPVIHLDFSNIGISIEDLEKDLKKRLIAIGEEYGKSINPDSARTGLYELVKALSQEAQVVVLVDEYDHPIIENLDNLEKAHEVKKFVRLFFGTLKSLDAELKFTFFTGVSKFTHVSLFSGLNILEDITMDPSYAALLGYTENEIKQYFSEYLELICQKQHKSIDQVMEDMRLWYNGYRFSDDPTTVYNPLSTLRFLMTGRTSSHWFTTATPTFLVNWITQKASSLPDLSGTVVNEELISNQDITNISLVSLMWQTGYLTIREYDSFNNQYILDYPNLEVKKSFLGNLVMYIAKISDQEFLQYVNDLIQSMSSGNVNKFIDLLITFFSSIPYDIHIKKEKYYQSLFFLITQLIGLSPQAEEKTNLGRIDTVIKIDNFIYIIEFKIDSTADEALAQINNKSYFQKYMSEGKELVLLGINFNTQKRNISDWKHTVISKSPPQNQN